MRNAYTLLAGKPGGTRALEDLAIDEMIRLILFLRK
jgi:hypothetical protein